MRRTLIRSGVSDDLRELLYARAAGRCEACGVRLEHSGMDPHHRKLRSQGGLDTPDNLLAVCRRSHAAIHANPAMAYAQGRLLRSWQDPAATPVRLWDGRLVLLTPEGGYSVRTVPLDASHSGY